MKEYVTKLIDRNIQRKRESGITNYALYSVLIIFIYNVLQEFPKIPINTHFNKVFFLLGLSFNLLVLGTITFSLFLILVEKNKDDIKIFNNPAEYGLLFSISLLGILFPSAINFFLTFQKFTDYSNNIFIYFLITSIVYAVIIISHFGVFFQEKKKKLNIRGNSNLDQSFAIFSFSFFLILSLATIYYLYTIKFLDFRKYNVFLFAIFLFGIFIILLKIVEESDSDSFAKSLENLEYEIYTKKLDDEVVREKLQSNYFGFLFQDWIEKKNQELTNFEKYFEDYINKVERDKIELNAIGVINFSEEHVRMQAIINDDEISLTKESSKFYEDTLSQIQNIFDSKKIKKEKEIEIIKELIENYKASKNKYLPNL